MRRTRDSNGLTNLVVGAMAAVTVLAACVSSGGEADGGRDPSSSATSVGDDPTLEVVPLCGNVRPLQAPEQWYRDVPSVGPGQNPAVEDVLAWARGRPGFEELFIDRADHNGWVSLAFSQGAEQAQEALVADFPDRAVVIVPVDWTMAELADLQARAVSAFSADGIGSGIDVVRGVTTIEFGVLTLDQRNRVDSLFAGERVCVSGESPATAPVPGQQQASGDGWRLLAAERERGQAFTTAIATTDGDLADLWTRLQMTAPLPTVDFDVEVVVLFGAVYGSSCPDLRFDGVFADDAAAVLYPRIVLVDPPAACTSDANAYAFVVAVERDFLPEPPFVIRLQRDEPPPGVTNQETTVTAGDLEGR